MAWRRFYQLSVLMFLTVVAQFAGARPIDSRLCDGALPGPNSVTCCSDSRLCEDGVRNLTAPDLDLIANWTSVLKDDPEMSWGPNCFLFALTMTNPHVSYPFKILSPHDFKGHLDASYRLLEEGEEPLLGDIVVITVVGLERLKEEENGRIVLKLSPVNVIAHGAVYLGDNMIIQKEDFMTAVISISTIDMAREEYLDLTMKSAPRPMKEATAKVSYYRLR